MNYLKKMISFIFGYQFAHIKLCDIVFNFKNSKHISKIFSFKYLNNAN